MDNKENKRTYNFNAKLKIKAIITNLETDWYNYKQIRNKVNTELRNAKKDYYSSKIASQKQNPKQARETINNLLGRQCKQTVVNQLDISVARFKTFVSVLKQ